MQLSVSEHQERSQKLQQEMGRRLQEKEQTIRAQREQVKTHSHSQLSLPTVIMSGEEASQRVSPCSGYPVFATRAQIVSY